MHWMYNTPSSVETYYDKGMLQLWVCDSQLQGLVPRPYLLVSDRQFWGLWNVHTPQDNKLWQRLTRSTHASYATECRTRFSCSCWYARNNAWSLLLVAIYRLSSYTEGEPRVKIKAIPEVTIRHLFWTVSTNGWSMARTTYRWSQNYSKSFCSVLWILSKLWYNLRSVKRPHYLAVQVETSCFSVLVLE